MLFQNKIGNLDYSPSDILIKKKKIKEELLLKSTSFTNVKIAVMSGSTTNEIVDDLELFLLAYGIKPSFYISKYGNYYEESVFIPKELMDFKPDIVYIHTCWRNLVSLPEPNQSEETIKDNLLFNQNKLSNIWNSLTEKFNCTIIQNNFDYCYYRLLGNMDIYDYRGINNFILKMNMFIGEQAATLKNLYINDFNYLQAKYGIDNFSDQKFWYLYKYAISINFIPYFSFNLAKIIKSLLGKNKKVLNLDLDNTLWGGVIGDDGVEGIKLGQGDPQGEYFVEFQKYLASIKNVGVLLTINSKNDQKNVDLGFSHPDSILKIDDFVDIKANWEPKNKNLAESAKDLNLGINSFVFVDDNPVERQIIKDTFSNSVDVIDYQENAIKVLDNVGEFECVSLTKDDLFRTKTYQENINRQKSESQFANYNDFLKSLEMEAEVAPFNDLYLDRISQLLNKTNQFNLTVNRLTKEQIEVVWKAKGSICLYAKLKDKYGDNGLVSVIIGEKVDNQTITITNWVMSCRVFSRGLEELVLNTFVKLAKTAGYSKIKGTYNQTDKNQIVKDIYLSHGFDKNSDSLFELDITKYKPGLHFIKVISID